MFVASATVLLGIIALADPIKPHSFEAISRLKHMGMSVFMLTGDNYITARAIQQQAGIKFVIAEVLPTEKEHRIRRLQDKGHHVAMVGDGINDAPR